MERTFELCLSLSCDVLYFLSRIVCLRTSKIQVWGCDLQVFCVQIILLIMRVKLVQKAFVALNVCFYVFRLFSRVKSNWRKMVHFGTYWSILEKRTKVNYEVKPEDTTIEDMHNLPSPLGEPKPIRRASFEIFLEGTSNSKWRQDLQVSPTQIVS